jgi:uncharacterized membrane protein
MSTAAKTVKHNCAMKTNCKEKPVKCYGIAKKGKNGCGTAKHACAGHATTDADPNDWIYVMKGNCKRIAGGSLTPATKK